MRFRERIAQFFYGRYGIDSLYYGLLVSILILWVCWKPYCFSGCCIAASPETFPPVGGKMKFSPHSGKKSKTSFFCRKTKSGILKNTDIKNARTAKQCCDCQSVKAPIL